MELISALIGLFIYYASVLCSILHLYLLVPKTQLYFWNVSVDSTPAGLRRGRLITRYETTWRISGVIKETPGYPVARSNAAGRWLSTSETSLPASLCCCRSALRTTGSRHHSLYHSSPEKQNTSRHTAITFTCSCHHSKLSQMQLVASTGFSRHMKGLKTSPSLLLPHPPTFFKLSSFIT